MTEHHVVVVGAGFGGLEFAKAVVKAPVRVTIIDQRNHHLFQPLALPGRDDLAGDLRDRVADPPSGPTGQAGHHAARHRHRGGCRRQSSVQLADGRSIGYDTLVLATGARHAYFGQDEWEAVCARPEDA